MSEIPPEKLSSHITSALGHGDMAKFLIETPWSRAEIYLHGAHITHFQKNAEPPLLFLSESSEFLAGKAIRGGVPIIFPWFGSREGSSAHGFARTAEWQLKETISSPCGSVRLHFNLPNLRDFNVDYSVIVAATLRMELRVTNTSTEDVSFENCLHTYLQVSAIHDTSVTGLAGTHYFDQLLACDSHETAPAIYFSGEIDRVYSDTSTAVEIKDPGNHRLIRIEKSGSDSTVIWNPWIEKSQRMSDIGDKDYHQMLCVESGNIGQNRITLPPGGIATLAVEISSTELI